MDEQLDTIYGATQDELKNISAVCTFEPDKVKQNGKMWEQEITLFIPNGIGKNNNQTSTLLRVFEKLKTSGKKIGNIKHTFYRGDNNVLFTLGSFVTTKKHILFFPGTNGLQITKVQLDHTNISSKMTLDHISLERNLRRYHITTIEKEIGGQKLPGQNTKKIRNSLFQWLVLGVASETILEKTPKKTIITLQSAYLEELKRRRNEIMSSREKAVFNVLSLNHYPEKDHYLNFEIFVSSEKLSKYPNIDKFYASTGCSNYKGPQDIGRSRIHRLRLLGFNGDVYIRLTKMQGILDHDCAIVTGPHILKSTATHQSL